MTESTYFNLSLWNPEIREGISLVTAVKNRSETLRDAIQTWIKHPEIDEIIIVDWSSDESLVPLVEEFQDDRIFLAIVKDQPTWILSYAYNLAARLSSRDKLLKMDADVKILPNFFNDHMLKKGLFYAGNWRLGEDENETHLNGLFYVFRADFFKANGFNEFIKTYGWDDTDLFSRFQSLGLRRIDMNIKTLHHIEHQARTIHQPSATYLKNIPDEEWARQNIFINRYLTNKLEKWSGSCNMMKFNILKVDPHTYICKQEGDDMNPISPQLMKEAEIVAMKDRLIELGLDLPPEVLSEISLDEMAQLLEDQISEKNIKSTGEQFTAE